MEVSGPAWRRRRPRPADRRCRSPAVDKRRGTTRPRGWPRRMRSGRPAGSCLLVCMPTMRMRRRAERKKPAPRAVARNRGLMELAGTRTPDLLGAIQALSQLSYSPKRTGRNRGPAVQGRIVAASPPARLADAGRRHDPAPALFPRPVAAVLRGNRRHSDDRGRHRAVSAARRERQLQARRAAVQAQTGAQNLYKRGARAAMVARGPCRADVAAGDGDQRQGQGGAIQRRLDQLAGRSGRSRSCSCRPGSGRFETGTPDGDRRRAGRAAGRATAADRAHHVSVDVGEMYAHEVERLLEVGARVDRGGEVLASTLPAAATVQMPPKSGTDVTIGGAEYRARGSPRASPTTRSPTVRLFTPVPAQAARAILVVRADARLPRARALFAVIVSRTLSAEVQRLLHAAQRLGRGDFSVSVPAEGNDEFAALGKEFNSMARQLEARLEDLRGSAGACRRRSAASASRSRAGWTASACSRSSCRRRSTASAPTAAAPRCAAAPTRRWRRSPAAATRGLPPRAARRRGGGDGRRRGRGDPDRRRERDGRAAVGHRGRRPRAGDRLRRPRRPPVHAAPSASCSPTSRARRRSRWRTSICTKPCSARRSRTSSRASSTTAASRRSCPPRSSAPAAMTRRWA